MFAHRCAPCSTGALLFVLLATALALTSCAPAPGPTPVALDSPLATPHPLIGSTWRLIAWRGGALVPRSDISLTFDSEWLRGSAGCNEYRAEYRLVGDQLHLGMTAVQVELCPEADLMAQERAYLDALFAAASIRIAGDRLELLDASGQTALVYERGSE